MGIVRWRHDKPDSGADTLASATGEDDRNVCSSMQLLVRPGELSMPRHDDVRAGKMGVLPRTSGFRTLEPRLVFREIWLKPCKP